MKRTPKSGTLPYSYDKEHESKLLCEKEMFDAHGRSQSPRALEMTRFGFLKGCKRDL